LENADPVKLQRREQWMTASLVFAIALVSSIGVLWMTRDGIGLSPDSRGYYHAANNVAAGVGPLIPDGSGKPTLQTHLAPGYGVWLGALRGITGGDVRQLARWWNAAALVLNVGLVAFIVWHATARWRLPTLMAAALAALSGPVLLVHVSLWSESTFILCLLTTLASLSLHIGTPRWSTLIVAGLATAGALMCRYAGASLVLAATWALFGISSASLRKRLLDCVMFGLISCGPMLAWIIYGKLRTGTTANRELAFKGLPTPDHVSSFFSTIGSFSIFSSNTRVISSTGAAITIGIVLVSLVAWLLERFSRSSTLAASSAYGRLAPAWLFVFVYPAFLIFSISFFDALTPLDARLLAPWHAALIVAVVGSIATSFPLWRRLGGKVLIGVIILQLIGAVTFLGSSSRNALGYSAQWWVKSPAIAWLRAIEPKGVPMYADIPEAVDFLVDDQWAKPLFRTVNGSTKRRASAADLDKALSGLRRELGLDPGMGYVIYFKPKRAIEKFTISPDELSDRLGLQVIKTFDDNCIILGPTPRTRELAIEHREKDLWYAGKSVPEDAEPDR
jgi:hypothetical protein